MRLFVFEGEKREIVFFETIKELFFKEVKNDYIICSFKNNIYNLYERMEKSREDILAVLKDVWKDLPDYPMIEALCYTKKLPDQNYIDYVASLDECNKFKHLVSQFSDYKNFDFIAFKPKKYGEGVCVNQTKIQKLKQNWQNVIEQNVIKANFICSNKKGIPKNKEDITQQKIFISQIQKYIPSKKLAILASYPLFLYDYFEIENLFCIS